MSMGKLPKSSLPSRAVGRFLRFGLLRGLRSVEIDPEEFRQYLANRHNLWIPHFGRMRDVPIEQLDAIAQRLIQDAQRIAMAQGAGFGLGGMITILPDASLLTIITLRLIQRLCLLYGFEEDQSEHRRRERRKMGGPLGAACQLRHRRRDELRICPLLGSPRAALPARKAFGRSSLRRHTDFPGPGHSDPLTGISFAEVP